MKILAVGDSLTEGCVTKETQRHYPCTATLNQQLLKRLDFKKMEIVNNVSVEKRPVSGEKTKPTRGKGYVPE
jgi:hypothetical protein